MAAQMTSHMMAPLKMISTRVLFQNGALVVNESLNNFTDPNFISGNLITGISDHLPQFLITSDKDKKTKPITEYSVFT